LLGHKYGWIPTVDEVPRDISNEYMWVPGTSITHMEILCGAYRTQNPNALFMFRDDSYLASLPEEYIEDYTQSDACALESLQRLKNEISFKFGGGDRT
jgi:hypothetical protein